MKLWLYATVLGYI